jgi:hypothetical protein
MSESPPKPDIPTRRVGSDLDQKSVLFAEIRQVVPFASFEDSIHQYIPLPIVFDQNQAPSPWFDDHVYLLIGDPVMAQQTNPGQIICAALDGQRKIEEDQ